MTSPARPPLRILTALRFFAAADVVAFHEFVRFPHERVPMGYGLGYHLPKSFFLGLASAGYQSVTFFFSLSGFILVYVYSGLLEQGGLNTQVREFWKARFARISPAYFLALALLLPSLTFKGWDFNGWLGLGLVPGFLQAWWPPTAGFWNSPAWSISVEMVFYALFPLLAAATARLSRNHLAIIAYCLVVAMSYFRSMLALRSSLFWWDFALFFPLVHLPQFIFGMALGRLYLFGPKVSPRIHVVMFCVGATALLLVFGLHWLFPWWVRTDAVLVLLFGLVIYGAARAESAFRVLASPWMMLLGEASYSIYILHVAIVVWWNWFMSKAQALGWSLPSPVNTAVYFALVISVSILTFRFVETPLRRRISGRPEHPAG